MEKDEKRLTEHFRMDEFIYSAMAVELGLNNALPSEVIPAIRNLTVRCWNLCVYIIDSLCIS